eukprot:365162-Chlamydomonas_euryale.AAC.4
MPRAPEVNTQRSNSKHAKLTNPSSKQAKKARRSRVEGGRSERRAACAHPHTCCMPAVHQP